MIESLGIGIPTLPRLTLPDFFFHYIIAILCAIFILCIGVLKFKYLYWYSQPITFRFTVRRFGGSGSWNTSIMNPLSLAERCNNAIVYPFLHFVQHDLVRVYGSRGDLLPLSDAPYERIAEFLSRQDTHTPAASDITTTTTTRYIPRDILEVILSQDTYGLSVFIGILGGNTPTAMKGVCVLTPRIMLSFGPSSSSSSSSRSEEHTSELQSH